MNAAGAAASSPNTRGSVRVCAPSTPMRVARFHSVNTEVPVDQNASRAESIPGVCARVAQRILAMIAAI